MKPEELEKIFESKEGVFTISFTSTNIPAQFIRKKEGNELESSILLNPMGFY